MSIDLVEKSIAAVYSAFEPVPKPQQIPGCEHCLSAEQADVLLCTMPKNLSVDDICGYAADVFLTMGCVEDFQYFLPRILELSVRGRFYWPDPEVVLRKLELAKWSHWSDSLANPVRQSR